MRAFVTLVLAVVIATGIALGALAASHTTKSGVNALSAAGAAAAAINSVATSPYVQVTATVGASGGGAIPAGQAIVLTFDENAEHAPTDIAAAGAAVDFSESLSANGAPPIELRSVAGKLYARLDLQAFAATAPPSPVASRAAFLAPRYGDRWYVLPDLFGAGRALTGVIVRVDERLARGAPHLLAATAHFGDAPNGPDSARIVVASGSARLVEQRVLAAARRLGARVGRPLPATPDDVGAPDSGYTLRLTMSAGGVLSNLSAGTAAAPGALDATVSHDAVAVRAPADATALPLPVLGALAALANR